MLDAGSILVDYTLLCFSFDLPFKCCFVEIKISAGYISKNLPL